MSQSEQRTYWTIHFTSYRLRSQLDAADIKVVDKFVFRPTTIDKWLGVCQQGFRICNCKQPAPGPNNPSERHPADNLFATEASRSLVDDQRSNPAMLETEIHRYMFCVRMSVPGTADGKENLFGDQRMLYNDFHDSPHGDDNKKDWDRTIACLHGYQVYPEFLIVFKKQ